MQVGGFLAVLLFPPPIKLIAAIKLKYCWNCFKILIHSWNGTVSLICLQISQNCFILIFLFVFMLLSAYFYYVFNFMLLYACSLYLVLLCFIALIYFSSTCHLCLHVICVSMLCVWLYFGKKLIRVYICIMYVPNQNKVFVFVFVSDVKHHNS